MTNTKKTRHPRAIATKTASASGPAGKARPAGTPTGGVRKTTPKAPVEPSQRVAIAAPDAAKPKAKLVRDSFTIPKLEYLVLEALKLRAAKLGRPSKKSEMLRAGIGALDAMNDKALLAALNLVPSLKTGRPKNVPPATPTKRSAAAK
jgi:hypothetical protein